MELCNISRTLLQVLLSVHVFKLPDVWFELVIVIRSLANQHGHLCGLEADLASSFLWRLFAAATE